MDDGLRAGQNELSTIDTALLLAGMLTSQSYFDQDTPVENEIRELVDSVYTRVDWEWMESRSSPPLIGHGWFPEEGMIPHDWTGYDEAMILYILALGKPDSSVEPEAGMHIPRPTAGSIITVMSMSTPVPCFCTSTRTCSLIFATFRTVT